MSRERDKGFDGQGNGREFRPGCCVDGEAPAGNADNGANSSVDGEQESGREMGRARVGRESSEARFL
jgi:hypothetical protein